MSSLKNNHNRVNDALHIVISQGYKIDEVKNIDYAKQIVLEDNLNINCFDTGRIVVQGTPSEHLNQLKILIANMPPVRQEGS